MIDDAAAVELLRRLCEIPSVSGDESAAVAFMVEQATRAGLRASVDGAGNFVATAGDGDRVIVLLGHIDTVPGAVPARVDAGIIHGRGAVDAKGPLAAFLVAVSRVTIPAGTRVVVIGAVEEEAPSSKGAHFVLDGYRPEVVIIGEPSGAAAITLGYKGRVSVRLRAAGPHAHSAAERRTVASEAVAWWSEVERRCAAFNEEKRVFDRLDPHLAAFNTATDGFEDTVEVRGSVRLPVDYPIGDLERQLRHAAEGWGTVDVHGVTPAFRTDKKNVLVRTFLQSLREMDLEPRFTLKTGTSDMNVVGPVWRCPIVAYGPGDSSLDHAPNEHVRVDEYLTAVRVLTGVIERLGM